MNKNIRHADLVIPDESPFENCKLERKAFALVLTDIVKTYADGFVLAINNKWGTGKTTFIKMWQQHLKNEDFQTVYFNAWENDFESSPLVAIMSELKTLTNQKNAQTFNSIIKKAAALVKEVAPAMIKAVVKKYVDTDTISDAIENAAKATTQILEEEIKEYATKKKTITEFRKELEKFIKESDDDKPLIFMIDELDRCRPTYAVEVLEQMKHFFSVPGIVFVLSIDKTHLASSVRGFYGSEHINTDEYLRRFIDLEYSIPEPSTENFCGYLFEYFSLGEFFLSGERKNITQFVEDGSSLQKMSVILFKNVNATLRQQEKVFAHTSLILRSFRNNNYVFPHALFVLVYIKQLKPDLYKNIEQQNLSFEELQKAYYEIIPFADPRLNLQFVLALILYFYNNNLEPYLRKNLVKQAEDGSWQTLIEGGADLIGSFNQIKNNWDYSDVSLKYLLNRINLTQPLFQQ